MAASGKEPAMFFSEARNNLFFGAMTFLVAVYVISSLLVVCLLGAGGETEANAQ
jgi:hypothetical protein